MSAPREPLDELDGLDEIGPEEVAPDAGATRVDIIVEAADEGLRLDRVLVRHLPEMSRTRLQALIADRLTWT